MTSMHTVSHHHRSSPSAPCINLHNICPDAISMMLSGINQLILAGVAIYEPLIKIVCVGVVCDYVQERGREVVLGKCLSVFGPYVMGGWMLFGIANGFNANYFALSLYIICVNWG